MSTPKQSTRHLLMIEPAAFYTNPQTTDTNVYQIKGDDLPREEIFSAAMAEFKTFRDLLTSNGVIVTTALGYEECPDMVFPNWMSTHQDGTFILYPMLNENRRAEIAPEIIDVFKHGYTRQIDWREYTDQDLFLESTASIVSDHVNKVGYAGLSARTTPEMVEKWGALMGYEIVMFDTQSHAGKPVYHTDFLMYIGTEMVGICAECIAEKDRSHVLEKLAQTHQVMEISMDQLKANCGNALEIIGKDDEKMLTMSDAAYKALTAAQLGFLTNHYETILHADLQTLEKYGGGSARCMLMEIFPVI